MMILEYCGVNHTTCSLVKLFLSGSSPSYFQYLLWLKMKKGAAAALSASVVFNNHVLGFVVGINMSLGYQPQVSFHVGVVVG